MGTPEFHRGAVEKSEAGAEQDRPAEGGWQLVNKDAPPADPGSHPGKKDPPLASLSAELREAQHQLEQTRGLLSEERAVGIERLRQADEIREETALGVRAFQRDLETSLRLYRGQRAWKVMLFLRKAYALLVRQGFRGIPAFVKWVASLARSHGRLAEAELGFPDVRNYVPVELQRSSLDDSLAEAAGVRTAALRKYDVIILTIFDFDFLFQRPQQMACQFARHGHRVFWISPGRRLPLSSPHEYEAREIRKNVWEVRLRADWPDIFEDRLGSEQAAGIVSCLEELYREWAIVESCVILQLPFWRRIGLSLGERFGAKVLYDCLDHWRHMPRVGPFNLAEEKKLFSECDVSVVTAKGMTASRHRDKDPSILIRNGVDYEFFSRPQANEEMASIAKPTVGYFGALADWFDYDLMFEVAEARPQYSFVLIGGYETEQTRGTNHFLRLSGLPNVHFLGHQAYSELPSFLAHFDACIIPFRVNELTRMFDPVKLYEYLSQGKPVVATEMAELEYCSNLIYVADDARDFAHKVDLALSEDDASLGLKRRSFAAANNWTQRFEAMDAAVRASFPLTSIVVVTRNSEDFIAPCLDSIRRNTSYPNYEVIVVDNASQDGTRRILASYTEQEPRLRVILQDDNAGFAQASNVGVEQAGGDYLALLNVDTIVTWGWLERLLRHCRGDTGVGAVLPVTNWASNEARINVAYTQMSEMEKFAASLARRQWGQSLSLEMVPLFCAVIPRAVWNELGPLDPRFQVGMFEDDDYSLRIRKAGLRIVCAEDCLVHHFGLGSFSKLPPAEYDRIYNENRFAFEQKWGVEWKLPRRRAGVPVQCVKFDPASFVAESSA